MKKNKQKTDTSPYIYQEEKIKSKLVFKDKIKWTEKQKRFLEIALHKDTRIMFVRSPAGCGKSLLSVYASLLLLDQKKVSEVMYIRSAVESSESKIGALPGNLDSKMEFYNMPFMDKLHELLPGSQVTALEKQKAISCFSTNFARGMSWNAKAIIMDEVQNLSKKENVTVLTRLGHFSRCFVLADPMQTDLPDYKGGAFEELYKTFDDEESRNMGIHVFEFTEDDIMRSEIVKFLVKRLNSKKA